MTATAVTVKVTNTGRRAGKEVAQLYVRDIEASVDRPLKELKGFAKVELAPGESSQIMVPTRSCGSPKRAMGVWLMIA